MPLPDVSKRKIAMSTGKIALNKHVANRVWFE